MNLRDSGDLAAGGGRHRASCLKVGAATCPPRGDALV